MARFVGFHRHPSYVHVDPEYKHGSRWSATDEEDTHQANLQLQQEGQRTSWRLAAAVSVLLFSVLFVSAALLSSKMPLSSQFRGHKKVLAKMRNAQEKNILPIAHFDISGSRLGKLWGMLAHQPTATASRPVLASSSAVPATAVLTQQQPPAGSASFVLGSSSALPATAVLTQQQPPAGSTSLATNFGSSNPLRTSVGNIGGFAPVATLQNSPGASQVGSTYGSAPPVAAPMAAPMAAPVAPPAAAPAAAPAAVPAVATWQNSLGTSRELETLPVSSETPLALQEPISCGFVQHEVDYPGNDLGLGVPTTRLEDCCKLCVLDQNCVAWTHVKVNQLCFLKGGQPRSALTAVSSPGTVSGKPDRAGRSFLVIKRHTGQSIFCFSLMLPWGYEEGLLKFQYSHGQGIFGCDEYAVYSNQDIQVADGVAAKIVNSNLHCTMGGEFGTCLNTPVFLAVWKRILTDNRPYLHDWTVKVDPDAVFFPARLRAILIHHKEMPRGIYLNNCKFGLHGPLEVFSRNAVAAWGSGRETCSAHFSKLCSGSCRWGEDMYIDQCLWKVLKISRVFEPNLLVEDHCAPPAGWKNCSNPTVASFHPFKDLEDHRQCMRSAEDTMNIVFK